MKEFRAGLAVIEKGDLAAALKILKPLAEQGHKGAQSTVGWMYEEGDKGVPQDYKEAAKWYLRASDEVNGSTWAKLGEYYEKGQGVPRDYVEAHKWFTLSGKAGNDEAEKNLGLISTLNRGIALCRGEFIARMDIGSDTNGEDKNEIRSAVTPSHRDYAQMMALGGGAPMQGYGQAPVAPVPQQGHAAPAQSYAVPSPQQQSPQPSATPGFSGRPSWAE